MLDAEVKWRDLRRPSRRRWRGTTWRRRIFYPRASRTNDASNGRAMTVDAGHEVPAGHATHIEWCFSAHGGADKEGWAYGASLDALEWFPQVSAMAGVARV